MTDRPIIFPGVIIGPNIIFWRTNNQEYCEERGGENEVLLLQEAIRQIEREREDDAA